MSFPSGASRLRPVDLTPFRAGNTGVDYAHRFDSGRPGEDVLLLGLVHGNELCGAHTLATLLERGIRPLRGSLTICFVNVAAYQRYSEASPTRARFVDEDMNRLWDAATLDGDRRSTELDRAREIRPLVEGATRLLDLHSMQTPAEPLMLTGLTARGRALAKEVGYPSLVVADAGHAAGRRLRDFRPFAEPEGDRIALLAECGQHQDPTAAKNALEVAARFLLAVGSIERDTAEAITPLPERARVRVIEVTERVTIRSSRFRFVSDFEGLDVIPEAGTVIAYDAGQPIATPYDDCVLIMPSRRLAPGQTAVRLGRFVS